MASDPSATPRSVVPNAPAAIPGPAPGRAARPPPFAPSPGGTAAAIPASAPSPLAGTAARALGPGHSLWGDAWRRLRRNRAALAGLAFIVLVAASAVLADVLAPY